MRSFSPERTYLQNLDVKSLSGGRYSFSDSTKNSLIAFLLEATLLSKEPGTSSTGSLIFSRGFYLS